MNMSVPQESYMNSTPISMIHQRPASRGEIKYLRSEIRENYRASNESIHAKVKASENKIHVKMQASENKIRSELKEMFSSLIGLLRVAIPQISHKDDLLMTPSYSTLM